MLAVKLAMPEPISAILDAAEQWFEDTQELLIALLLEPFGDLIDGLTECMANPYGAELDPSMPIEDLKALIKRDWDWATALDFESKEETAQFWYVSEAKQEPRLGQRHEEDGAKLESPLDIARQVANLATALEGAQGITAELVLKRPDLRFAVRRVQTLAD